jgi:hypothetical protein
MDLLWNPPLSDAWARFHRENAGSLQQSWAYGEALRTLGVEVVRVVAIEGGKWLACAQFIARRLLGYISLASCSRGPVFAPDADPLLRRAFIFEVRRKLPLKPLRVPLFSPNTGLPDWNPDEVRGLSRVLTGYSTTLIDLTLGPERLRADMDGKWRNRLVRAETRQDIRVFFQPSRTHLRELLSHEVEQRHRKGFFGLPTEFVSTYLDVHDRPAQAFRLAWAQQERQTIACMLFLLHGQVATYHMGWANDAGREANAHNLLMWRAMLELPQAQVRWLDTGGVNTHDLAGISRFKLGAGGQVLTLPGTFF